MKTIKTAWNKGKKMPLRSEEYRRNIGFARKGKHMSQAAKDKLSKSLKILYADKKKHPRFGKYHSEESKKKMSEVKKTMYQSGKYNPRLGKYHSEESKKKMSIIRQNKRGPQTSNWKGGRWRESKRGYIFILNPHHPFCDCKGYVLEHRLVIEKMLQRFLKPFEHGHHINKNKSDNRPENLMAFKSQAIHNFFEKGKAVRPKDIVFDGRNFHY